MTPGPGDRGKGMARGSAQSGTSVVFLPGSWLERAWGGWEGVTGGYNGQIGWRNSHSPVPQTFIEPLPRVRPLTRP